MGIASLGGCRATHSVALLAVPLASAAPCLPSHQFTFQIMMLCLWLVPLHLSPSSQAGQGDLRGKGMFYPRWLTVMPSGVPSLGEGCSNMSLGWWGPSIKNLAGCGGEGEGKKPRVSRGGSSQGGNDAALTVIAVAVSWGRRSLANPQEGTRGLQKGNEDTAVASGAVASPVGA